VHDWYLTVQVLFLGAVQHQEQDVGNHYSYMAEVNLTWLLAVDPTCRRCKQ
jgi:hypothetical protein